MLIDLVQLRTFVVVAETQHLTRAAERLHVSQSTASAHIRSIEDALDIQLFARSNRNMELTRAGGLLLRQAKMLLNGAAEFSAFAREIRGKLEGDLMIGTSGEPSASRIGEIVSALRSTHPLITPDLRALPSLGVRQALKTGELDIGMMLCEPLDPEFTYHQLDTVALRIAGPVAWRDQIESGNWAELARLPWITPNDVSFSGSTLLSRFFNEKGLELNTVARFDRAAVGRLLALAGVGMLLMREDQALECEKEGSLALSPRARPRLPLVVAHVSSRGNSPLIRAFLDATRSIWPEMIPVPGVAERLPSQRDQ
jgi:DNA-binding transcriptional LysR family regulator